MENTTLAYIAGLFDGEGSARTSTPKASNGKRYPKLEVRIAQADRDVLDWIKSEFGFGSVYSKADKRAAANGWKECYDYVVAHRMARKFLTAIEPFLVVKKEKVAALLDEHGRLELD
jgi:hypothetical protein